METHGKFSSNGIHARSLNEVGKDLLPIDETFSCVLVENVKMNVEGQLIGVLKTGCKFCAPEFAPQAGSDEKEQLDRL